MPHVSVRIMRLAHGMDLPLPGYGSDGAACFDLCAAVDAPVRIGPHRRVLIPCGFAVALPAGFEMQIRPRSGLALKSGVWVHVGTLDADYRGEVGCILLNTHPVEAFEVTRGMRIAQAVVVPVPRTAWVEVASLDETARASGGYGSTGTGLTGPTFGVIGGSSAARVDAQIYARAMAGARHADPDRGAGAARAGAVAGGVVGDRAEMKQQGGAENGRP